MRPARLVARTARRRDRNRAHRHVALLAPQPFGAVELPVVFSAGAYEGLIARVSAQTGAGILGGPLLSWCHCGAPDPRRPGAPSPYWAVTIPDADAIRAAVEADVAALVARLEGLPRERWIDELFGDAGAGWHEGDPHCAPCRYYSDRTRCSCRCHHSRRTDEGAG